MEQINQAIREYLLSKGWKFDVNGGIERYYKCRDPSQVQKGEFITYSKRKIPLMMEEIVEHQRRHFESRGFYRTNLDTILSPFPEDPLFVSAGIQFLSEYLHKGIKPNRLQYFFEQPAIRTQFRGKTGEGKVSSFVNISSARVDSNPELHLQDIDLWICFLSKLGLFVNDFVLELDTAGNEREGWYSHAKSILKFKYGGMEIGTSGYLQFDELSPISDLGFGLERLTWMVNKIPFPEVLGPNPISSSLDPLTLDSIRSMTLMALSGIRIEDKDRYRQFRLYAENLSKDLDLFPLVKHYFTFWRQFITAKRSLFDSIELIQRERNQNKNSRLFKKLSCSEKMPDSILARIYDNEDEFIKLLIKRGLFTSDQIRGNWQ